ncbi:MAG TPA: calcium-binding EGF-like domain-containing protein [Polyangiaceae bacterium]|nr:calcium-binding EGF-like domain-containing protein [Polyangiaceae bacterium]
MKWRALTPIALGALLSGCEDSVSGFLSCGIDVCSVREECVETPSGPACVCAEGFEGSGCGSCASGYKKINSNKCELIPIDCDDNPTVCGLHGSCLEQSSGDVCECDELNAGRLCELCKSGYQDNDSDGSCRATCASAGLDCKAPSRCSDTRGTALCECPAGYTGDDCSRCALGFRDTGTSCVPTCAAATIVCARNQTCVDASTGARCECSPGYAGATCGACAQGYREDPSTGSCLPSCDGPAGEACGEHGQCDDSVGFARCVCDLGYTAEGCVACTDGFEAAAGGDCQRSLSSAETLVMLASYQSREVLATLDPSTGAALPLAEVDTTGLASGADPQTLFLNQNGGIARLTLPEASSEIAVPSSGAVGSLAWDAMAGRVYGLTGKAPFTLLSIEPASKTVVELFDTQLAGVSDLAVDATQNRVLALRDTLHAISLVDGAVTNLGALPPATVGIEVTADGTLLALSATGADEAASRVQACRVTASRLRIAGFAGATGRFVEPAASADMVTLEAVGTNGPEVLSYLGRGATSVPRTIELAVQNPQAFVCLALEEATLVQVVEAASFRGLVIYTADSDVELVVASQEAETPSIYLGGYVPSFTYAPRADIVEYTLQEWPALRLPIDSRYYQPGPGVLHTLSATLEVQTSTVLTGGSIPAGALSSWTPVAP